MRPGLEPGVNVDRVNVARGLREAVAAGYDDANSLMVVDYCLSRWAKGEEDLAEKTAISMGIDFTSWRRILAAGVAAGR